MVAESIAHRVKRCSRCCVEKKATREHFSFLTSQSKWHAWCKPCCAEQRREDRAKRPEHYAAIEKRRYQKHREKRLERCRIAWQAKGEQYNEINKRRYAANRERYCENRRRRVASDPAYHAVLKARQREDYRTNFEKRSAAAKQRWANATQAQRLRTYIGAAIAHSLAGRGKGGRGWQEILGYTADDLRQHLERQFAKGMTWDNYGDWHVDHILPVASFQFESADDPEFRACWALTNLRPLWATENIRKSDNRLHLI